MRRTSKQVVICVASTITSLVLIGTPHLCAQAGSQGTVTVTVVDQTGSVVPGAKLTLQDLATNDLREATTQAVGTYNFVGLNVGTYRLSASKTGYAKTVYDAIAVQASRVTDINAVLKVGATSETVTVSAEAAPLVESTSSAIGSNIDMKQIEDLPLGDRDLTALAVLSPGFTGGNYNPGVYGTAAGTWNGLPGAAQVASVDGVIAQSSRFKDGGNALPGGTAASPRIQNIQEMAIQTDQIEANQGYGQGNMQVTYVTRSGTNHFHGRLFADLQNSSFNANSWQNDFNGVPIPLYHKNDLGGSVGGPILKDKLFFFFSFERDGIPGTQQLSSNFMTPSMQKGTYTYLGTDNAVHTVNLLTLAGTGGANGTADPTVAGELTKINGSVTSGKVAAIPGVPYNVQQVIFREPNNQYWDYPTFRVDFDATQKLRVNLALNETKYSAPTTLAPTFPGPSFAYQQAGSSSNAYTASLGIDYTVRPTLINQFRFGYLYNSYVSANNQAGDPQKYKFINYWNGVDGLSYQCPNFLPCSGDAFYSRINNFYPLINSSDNIVWQHKSHTLNFGISFYREQDHYWNPPAGWTGLALGLAGGDPALNVFTSSNPALATANASQIGEMQGFYSILSGDIANLGGTHPLDAQTHAYTQFGSYNLNELQRAWGVSFQDSWRMRPNLTVNYGLRWDFTGDDHDLQNLYYSPPQAGLFGVSGYNNLFNPGSELGKPSDLNYLGRGHAYAPWNVSPQPNLGIAWSPQFTEGFLGKLTGGNKTVVRAGYSLRRYTEQYQSFWSYASNYGAFFFQGYSMSGVPSGVSGLGTYPAGSLSVHDFATGNYPSNFFLSPPSFSAQISEASQAFVGAGLNGMNPHIGQPYIQSWNLGFQRQMGTSTALEVRYLGNRGVHEWVGLNTNEVNIFQSGFLQQFKAAQQNLAINNASNNPNFQGSFANNHLAGQQPLPLFQAAFAGEGPGPDGNFVDYSNGNFTGPTGTLALGQVGTMANQFAGFSGYNANYLCNLVPASSATGAACVNQLQYAGTGGTYPENLFQANPYYPQGVGYLNSVGYSNYNGLQIEVRQKPWHGMDFHANYTWSKNLGVTQQYTLRNLRLAYNPLGTDRRNVANIYGTFDLPFGKGRTLLNSNSLLDRAVGGWTLGTIVNYTSGIPFQLTGGNDTFNELFDGGIVLNGVTASQIQDSIGVYRNPACPSGQPCNSRSWIDPKFIAANGLPSSQITPNEVPGSIGYRPWFYAQHHFTENISVTKAVAIREGMNFSLQGEFLNVFNHPEWDLLSNGGTLTPGSANLQSNTFGQFGGVGGSRVIEVRANFEF